MPILTTQKAAEKLGVSASRVIHLIHAGRLKATRFGRVYMIDAADLAAVRVRKPGRPRRDSAKTRK